MTGVFGHHVCPFVTSLVHVEQLLSAQNTVHPHEICEAACLLNIIMSFCGALGQVSCMYL